MWLEVQARREFEQVNKIVLIESYDSPRAVKLDQQKDASGRPDPRRIVFLRAVPGGLELTVEGALEALTARTEVLKLAKARTAGDAQPIQAKRPRKP